jgi:hypothetical protein
MILFALLAVYIITTTMAAVAELDPLLVRALETGSVDDSVCYIWIHRFGTGRDLMDEFGFQLTLNSQLPEVLEAIGIPVGAEDVFALVKRGRIDRLVRSVVAGCGAGDEQPIVRWPMIDSPTVAALSVWLGRGNDSCTGLLGNEELAVSGLSALLLEVKDVAPELGLIGKSESELKSDASRVVSMCQTFMELSI